MRIKIAIVSETSGWYLNQVKLCLHSLRKSGGSFSKLPVTLITNSEALSSSEQSFFKDHFSPIEFVVAPRLGAIAHTSKLNVFYSIDPSTYDLLFYLDCDTVIRKPLDTIADPILKSGAQFLCRRGGESDRNRFVDFNNLVSEYCGEGTKSKIIYNQKEEWPMFNTGVFLATSETVKKIRRDAIEFTYSLFNKWQRINALEKRPFLKYFYKLKLIPSKQKVLEDWTIEQGALALACIKAGIKVTYLDETFNSWGNLDFSILHCFKSAYKFNRNKMFSNEAETWLEEYSKSDLLGKKFLAETVREYIKNNPT